MFLIFRQAPAPVAHQWTGRRWLAVLDAVGWPALWVAGVASVPFKTGATGAFVMAVALCFAFGRFWKAAFHNDRYRFTTWRWGRPLLALLLIGASMRFMALCSGIVAA